MGHCNSIVPSSGSLSISERVRHLQKTPFFMYLDESQLKDMAMCFSTSKTYSQSSTVSLMPNSISVVASGELSMSTLLPSNTSKAGQSRGYLCKKVSGDIVNKMATTADAKRKVSSAKLTSFVEDVQTIATAKTLLIIADPTQFDEFLEKLEPSVKSNVEKITKSAIHDSLETLPFLQDMKKTQLTMLASLCRYEAVGKGDSVFKEGDKGDKLFILLNGCCSVHVTAKGDEGQHTRAKKTLMTTQNGELFGGNHGSSKREERSVNKRFSLDATNSIGNKNVSTREDLNQIISPKITPIKDTSSQKFVSGASSKFWENKSVDENGQIELAILTDNDYFGETALMVNIPRTTSVSTIEKSLFITVSKNEFQNFLLVCPAVKEKMERVMKDRMIGKLSNMQIPFFQGITDLDMEDFSSSVEMHEFAENDVVFKEGDDGDKFFIIIHGEVRVEHSDPEKVVDIGHLGPGKYFGEMALVSDVPTARSATIVANKHAILLSIGKEVFHKFFDNNPLALMEFKLRLMEDRAELRDLLSHPNALEAFRNYLKSELADENLEFWCAQREFVLNVGNEVENLAERANKLFDTYLSTSADLQVNIPGKMRTEIKAALDSGKIDEGLFGRAEAEIYKLMVRDNYARFKRTSEFCEFFKSLGILIQNKALTTK